MVGDFTADSVPESPMGRLSKTFKKYERHFLLGLVVLLLLTFSVGGAVSCQDKRRTGTADHGGEFLLTPSKSTGLDNNEFLNWRNRLDPYRHTVRVPSLRYGPILLQVAHDDNWLSATWSHVLPTEAARAAGYECGEEYQLKAAVQQAVEGFMHGMAFNDATYDRFIREHYRRSAKDFEQIVREVVVKDAFIRPLIETQRFEVSYEQAYEIWKNLLERVDLEYVALQGSDFNLQTLRQERTRDRIGAQVGLLDQVSRTARNLEIVEARVQGWLAAHDGSAPESLDELAGAGRQDEWGNDLRYTKTEDGYDLRSAGPDEAFDSSDDVTPETVAQLETRAALREAGAALLRWREATDAWPESLQAMREPPAEGALAPLTGTAMDAWDAPLVYDTTGEVPVLSAMGPDGEAGTDDDVSTMITQETVQVPAGPAFVAYLLDEDQDVWDRPLRIDLAHALTWQWTVSSAGEDGVFGTDDDLDTGNHAEVARFYTQPEVRIEFEVPEKKEFEAVYVHLPLVPDEALGWLLETYPQHRPDEQEAFNRWRQLHEYSYYMAEDPADPESGHGAAYAQTVAPDHSATLVPASTVFGEVPEGFLGVDDSDREAYVEQGWRPILLREMFLESLLNDLLTRARDSREAVQAWEEKKKGFDEGEGEDPGERPAEITFQGLLDTELVDFLPKEGAVGWVGLFRTAEPLARADIETLEHIGDINLTLTLQGMEDDGVYAGIPTMLNDSHTKAILRLVADHPRHDRPLEEIRDLIFDRFVEAKRLDLASKALEALRAQVEEAEQEAVAEPTEGEPAPAALDRDAIWTKTVEAWKTSRGVQPVHETTGVFVGARPPSAEEADEDVDEAEKVRIHLRDFVRATGYDALRPGPRSDRQLEVGDLARTLLRDDLTDGSDSVFLVRLKSVSVPPREAFSPRAYADYLSVEILGGPKGGRRLGAVGGGGRVTGNFQRGLLHFFNDFPWLRSKFDLRTEVDPEARDRQ